MTEAELAWCGRFDLVVTHDPLPPAQVRALHRQGTRLVLYEWAVAFYASLAKPDSWEASLLAARRGLLNERPLRGGPHSPYPEFSRYDFAFQTLEENQCTTNGLLVRCARN
jgi:hypothetical protein